jgi:hypothetical protein
VQSWETKGTKSSGLKNREITKRKEERTVKKSVTLKLKGGM